MVQKQVGNYFEYLYHILIKLMNVDWSEIRYIRLVWSGVESKSELGIAKIELVGNDWQELGIAEVESEEFTEY